MPLNKNLYTSSTSVLDAAIIYDTTKTKTQATINSEVSSSINGINNDIDDIETEINTLEEAASNKVLYLTSVAISASATQADIATVSNNKITASHVLVECVFTNPSYITTDVTWTTGSGSLVLNGTCTTATTANIVLIKKDN